MVAPRLRSEEGVGKMAEDPQLSQQENVAVDAQPQLPNVEPGPESSEYETTDDLCADERKDESKGDVEATPTRIGSRMFHIGQDLDVLDTVGKWSEAQILKIDRATNKVLVTYLYWGSSFDEWIDATADRFALLHTHTYVPGKPFKVGQRIEALDERNMWLEAFILDVQLDGKGLLVHYKGFSSRFDTWISEDAIHSNVRPYGRTKGEIIKRKKLRSCASEVLEGDRRPQMPTADKFSQYTSSLHRQGLRLVHVPGDGNCLFRSVSHQVYGDDSFHALVREKCMDYMLQEAEFFRNFVEGDIHDFHRYVYMMRQNSVWGDDPELQAICEMYDRPCEIWAYDAHSGARKLRTFHEAVGARGGSPPMRLSYYGGGHYDSLCGDDFHSLLIRHDPGHLEEAALERSRSRRRAGVAAERAASGSSVELDAELDLALEMSRREFDNHNDDLDEEVLAASMEPLDMHMDSKDGGPDMTAMTDEDFERLRKRTDLIESQGQIISSVAAQSEREEIERAIVESMQLTTNPAVTEEELLRQAMEHSLKIEAVTTEEELLKQVIEQSLKPDTEDEEMRLALELSLVMQASGTEDPQLSQILYMSQLDGQSQTNTPTHASSTHVTLTADEELQRALELSMMEL